MDSSLAAWEQIVHFSPPFPREIVFNEMGGATEISGV